MTNQNTFKHPKFSKLDSVASQVGMGKSTILAWESTGRFPRAVRLSPTIRVWLQQDIDNWVREKHEKAIAPTNSLELEEAQDACERESKA
jgi:prophage regulatory protein